MQNFKTIFGYWIFVQRMKMLSFRMRWVERLSTFVAWSLPRSVAGWCFIRVITEGCEGNPGDQKVVDVMNRWLRKNGYN